MGKCFFLMLLKYVFCYTCGSSPNIFVYEMQLGPTLLFFDFFHYLRFDIHQRIYKLQFVCAIFSCLVLPKIEMQSWMTMLRNTTSNNVIVHLKKNNNFVSTLNEIIL
jgi:hypothetical protein